MDKEKLNEIIEKHKKWLNLENGGVRADLSHSDLSHSDLSHSDLSHSDLSHSDLSHSNLRSCNLSHSNLSHSDIDYACWPLWCMSLDACIDDRIARQLLYHLMRPCLVSPDVSDKFKKALFTPELISEANAFHHVGECGLIDNPYYEVKTMDKAIRLITANLGVVSAYVSANTRSKIRRAARAAAVIVGYTAGVAAFVMMCVSVAQSALLWPVMGCAGVAGIVAWRCRG